ncbi:MAG: hypothetical protein AAFY16_06360 [Cyanobacteria bacterium J06642_3]
MLNTNLADHLTFDASCSVLPSAEANPAPDSPEIALRAMMANPPPLASSILLRNTVRLS